jgi:hypothetical protein
VAFSGALVERQILSFGYPQFGAKQMTSRRKTATGVTRVAVHMRMP